MRSQGLLTPIEIYSRKTNTSSTIVKRTAISYFAIFIASVIFRKSKTQHAKLSKSTKHRFNLYMSAVVYTVHQRAIGQNRNCAFSIIRIVNDKRNSDIVQSLDMFYKTKLSSDKITD